MARLVGAWGRTGFALATSLIWFLPMAAWAGTVDLYQGPLPWLAFGIGTAMLLVWLGLVGWASRLPVAPARHRFEPGQMSSNERAWLAGFSACVMVLVGWLNAAATVDMGGFLAALQAHRPGLLGLALALMAVLAGATGGAFLCWHRAAVAYRHRP